MTGSCVDVALIMWEVSQHSLLRVDVSLNFHDTQSDASGFADMEAEEERVKELLKDSESKGGSWG